MKRHLPLQYRHGKGHNALHTQGTETSCLLAVAAPDTAAPMLDYCHVSLATPYGWGTLFIDLEL